MDDSSEPQPRPSSPGPVWAWTSAWSLQGAAALGAAWAWPEPGWIQFTLMGLGAGVPLCALYLWLRARGA